MLIIRFRRTGKKNKPTYRVVVAEHTFPIDGKFTADLGSYNPHTKVTSLKKDEALEWLKKGAKPSNSVARLFEKEKIKHNSVVVIKRTKKPRKQAEEATKAVPAAAPAETAVEETPAETPTEETVVDAVEEPVAEATIEEPAEQPAA